MKKQVKRFVYLLLSFVFLATTMLGFSGPASAGTGTTALSSLAAGSTVTFGGMQWIALDPGSGYLLNKNGYYAPGQPYPDEQFNGVTDSSAFNPNDNECIASYLNNSNYDTSRFGGINQGFYQVLSSSRPKDAALVQTHWWTTGPYGDETSSYVYAKIGLISYGEYNTYKTIIPNLSDPGTAVFWTRTPAPTDEYGDAFVWTMPNSSGIMVQACGVQDGETDRPALYLDPNTQIDTSTSNTVYAPQPQAVAITVYSVGPGTAGGTTEVTTTPNNTGDTLAVKVSSGQITPPDNVDPAPTGSGVTSNYISGSDISGVTSGDYVGVYELDSLGNVVAFSQIQLTAGDISAAAPAVTGISPTSGSTAGGTPVTITGTGFTGATGVDFGGTAATSVNVVSDTSITVASPAGTGTVDVTVTGPGGTSATVAGDKFTYVVPAPAVTGISPTSGSTAGGTPVTITGTGFTGATGVDFGGTAATDVVEVSDMSITATSPPQAQDTVDVTVTGPGGTSATSSADQFSYQLPAPTAPTVTGISPTSGTTAGGTPVTITGTGFTGATGVDFGGTAATSVNVVSDTSITAASPAGTGTVDVTLTGPGGTSATVAGDKFTYVVPAPAVTGISPTSGSTAGGTPVTITGTGFTGATGVDFGGTAATSVNVVSDTSITAASPAGTGTVDVTVTGPGGTSAAVAGDRFTYTSSGSGLAVTGLSPATGPESGGTSVTISGQDLSTVSAVYFGSALAASFTVGGDKSVTGLSPHGSGSVDVTVYSPEYGYSATVPADVFTYYSVSGSVYTVNDIGQDPGSTPVTINVPPTSTSATNVDLGDNVSLDLPSGTNAPATITVQPGTPVDGVPVFQFTADGGGYSFNQPITITLPVPAGVTNPQVYYEDSDGVLELITTANGSYDSVKGTITFTTDHFSKYAVAGVSAAGVPVATSGAGTYTGSQTVGLSSANATKILYYTATATPSGFDYSQSYQTISGSSGSVTIGSSEYLVAVGLDINGFASTPLSAEYTINSGGGGGGGGGGSSPVLAITTTSLASGTVGQSYNQTITTNDDGTAPYTFTATSGSLPDGLALDASTGIISGTPTTAGAYTFIVTVKDANGESADESYTMTVNPANTTTPSPTPPLTQSVTLSDIAGNWAHANIEKLVTMGAITGYPDGTFRPDNDITRAEFVTVLVKSLKLTPKTGPVFVDVSGTWAQTYVSTAAAYGIVSGYDADHFGANDPITREQMTAMVVRAANLAPISGDLNFKDAGQIDAWARGYIITGVKDGIVHGYPPPTSGGYPTFRPLADATRAEAVTVIAGLLK